MSTTTQQFFNRIDPDLDVMKKRQIVDPGPYEGIIKNNSDVLRTGRIEVYIPAFGGPEQATNSWIPIQWSTPYYGKTDKDNIGKDQLDGIYSYGMWMSPPDPGVRVVVTFLEGIQDKGVCIGCLIDDMSNHMTPGIPSSKHWLEDPKVFDILPAAETGRDILPVIERNVKFKDENRSTLGVIKRPVNIPLLKIFKQQGLLNDTVRGQSFSSSQRENNSSVYGISTPGRSVHTDPATNIQLKARMEEGTATEEDLKVKERLPGHMFIMDDGDVEGDSNLIRLRTSTGHQILMDDKKGIVYVATASGNAWIEMDNTGNTNAYSAGNFSVHCEGTFNVQAGGNINLEADMNVNIKSKEAAVKIHAEDGTIDAVSEKGTYIQSEGPLHVRTAEDQKFTALDSDIHHNGPEATVASTPTTNDLVGSNNNKDVLSSIANVVPEHEPWSRGDE